MRWAFCKVCLDLLRLDIFGLVAEVSKSSELDKEEQQNQTGYDHTYHFDWSVHFGSSTEVDSCSQQQLEEDRIYSIDEEVRAHVGVELHEHLYVLALANELNQQLDAGKDGTEEENLAYSMEYQNRIELLRNVLRRFAV